MNRSVICMVVVLFPVLAAAAHAKKNNPDIYLDFKPQQAVAGVTAAARGAMLEHAVTIRLTDDRKVREPDNLGTRTDDDDRLHTLMAVNGVGTFVGETLGRIGSDWGLDVQDGAGLVLDTTLIEFEIVETNQAVGATYNASVRLAADLKSGGRSLWSGSGLGDATRYGRKFSNENVNEVLSDALLEAFAQLIGEPALERAWSGEVTSTVPSSTRASAQGAPARPRQPQELLAEIEKLMAQGFEESTMIEYVEQQILAAPMSADDLQEWKAAHVPGAVIKAALRRPVRSTS